MEILGGVVVLLWVVGLFVVIAAALAICRGMAALQSIAHTLEDIAEDTRVKAAAETQRPS